MKNRQERNMNNQKTGNTLNLALDATSREREASMNLNAGYEKETQRWKLIIRYFGAASELETDEIVITPLLGNYGIADIPQDQIERVDLTNPKLPGRIDDIESKPTKSII